MSKIGINAPFSWHGDTVEDKWEGENQEAAVVLNAFKPKQKWTKNMFDALGETLHYYFWGKNIKYKMQL